MRIEKAILCTHYTKINPSNFIHDAAIKRETLTGTLTMSVRFHPSGLYTTTTWKKPLTFDKQKVKLELDRRKYVDITKLFEIFCSVGGQ